MPPLICLGRMGQALTIVSRFASYYRQFSLKLGTKIRFDALHAQCELLQTPKSHASNVAQDVGGGASPRADLHP
jgi:hypothetical protein